jgi:hypothetical protein
MKFARTTLLGLTIILVMAAATPPVLGQAVKVRWDIVSLTFGPPPNFLPLTFYSGGHASASADDGSYITLTGSGTFVAPAGRDGTSSAATGGGTWQTFDSTGTPTGSGTTRSRGSCGGKCPQVFSIPRCSSTTSATRPKQALD